MSKKNTKNKKHKKHHKDEICTTCGRYFNRELSWIKFNERVLQEAQNPRNPLLERLNFLAIVGDNLDEYFMVRIPEYQKGAVRTADEYEESIGSTSQLGMIYDRTIVLMRKMAHIWSKEIKPELEKEGIFFTRYDNCTTSEKRSLKRKLQQDYSEMPFPIIRSDRFDEINHDEYLQGMCLLAKTETGLVVVLIQQMIEEQGRIIKVSNRGNVFIFREDLIRKNPELYLPGEKILSILPARLTRDSDLDLKGDDAGDLISAIKSAHETLAKKMPSRLEIEQWMPFGYASRLANALSLLPELVYDFPSPLGLSDLKKFSINRPDLKYQPFTPAVPAGLADTKRIFEQLTTSDQMLFTPYDSFSGLTNFLTAAANDPLVTKIQMTLYRLGSDSPVAEALILAAQNNKEVTAVIELKASFDEEANFLWEQKLADAGVKVIHGPSELKVHGKCCLVTRNEDEKKVYYSTVSTGNYNAKTAHIYSDLSIFTAHQGIGSDLAVMFDKLSGSKGKPEYNHLLISPEFMEERLLELIRYEVAEQKKSGNSRIIIKVNSLTERTVINALYDASNAGVKIDLIVRGICMLRPGVSKLSENIRVISIVGRFLEHARVFYFYHGGDEQLFIGSPDLMSRNLKRRVEILCPVYDSRIRSAIIGKILQANLSDKVGGRVLLESGVYHREKLGKTAVSSQEKFIRMRKVWW